MKIKWIYGKTDFNDCFSVRKKVFIDEQKFSEELEFDKIDERAHHVCFYSNNSIPFATARLFLEDNQYHVGRICILKEYRGNGMGNILMSEIEKKAKELFAKELFLSAQVRVKPFYLNLGYKEKGHEYLDEYCPHIDMYKKI